MARTSKIKRNKYALEIAYDTIKFLGMWGVIKMRYHKDTCELELLAHVGGHADNKLSIKIYCPPELVGGIKYDLGLEYEAEIIYK